MDAQPTPERPASAPGRLALDLTKVVQPSRLRSIFPLRDLTAIASWSWYSLETPLFAEDLAMEPDEPTAAVHLALAGERPVGYLEARHYTRTLQLANVLVDPVARRRGVGTQLVEAALGWSSQPWDQCETFVAERNLDGQLFWRAMGFTGRKCKRAPLIRFAR